MSLFTRDRGVADGGPRSGRGGSRWGGRWGGRGGSPDGGTGAAPDGTERTVRIARRRFVRRRWARRWLAWRWVVVGLLLLGLLIGGGWLVLFSPVLAVSGVQVQGSRVLTPAAVRRAADVPEGAPLATVDLDAIRTRVRRLPAVADADVSRSWPDRVLVQVTERRAVAALETARPGDGLQAVDASGVVFRRFRVRPDLPVVRRAGTGRGMDTAALAEAVTVAASLPPALAARVAYVDVRTVDRITLRLRSGREVRWGSADDSADKARVLAVLLGQRGSYYDVSTPGQPILRR